MQKDFLLPDSPWCLHGALDILPNVMKTIDVARQRGVLIIRVVREHDEYGRDIELFRRASHSDNTKPKPVCKGSVGAELVDGLLIKKEDYKIVKTRFSSFLSTNLHLLLQDVGITSLLVTGIQTPNCIRQTVFDAVSLDYQSLLLMPPLLLLRMCILVLTSLQLKQNPKSSVGS